MQAKVNPFSDYGGIVPPHRFIGRTVEHEHIRKRVFGKNFGNLAIIGLPRIGKSSLAWNSIISAEKDLNEIGVIPLWMPLGEFTCLNDFLDEVLSSTSDKVLQLNPGLHATLASYHRQFLDCEANVEKRRFVKKFFRTISSNNQRLLLVIDEFDNAQDIFSLQDFQFLREISYNPESKICIVTISRKTIQELEPDFGSLSNFYQIFDELRLGLFSDNDMHLYWERLQDIGYTISAEYQEKIVYYTGRHPFLVDLVNYSVINVNERIDQTLDQTLVSALDAIKLKLLNEYESILKLMEREQLLDKLIQIIIGPVVNITQRDVEKLMKYSLVVPVGTSLACFAKFFEEYLALKSHEIDIWPLWAETESEVRRLIKRFLLDKYGEDWVDGFIKGNPKKLNMIDELKLVMSKNIKSFGERASTHLVDYTYPSHMIDCFIQSDWGWFGKIFRKQLNEWKPKFDLLSEIRNPLAHNNRNFLTQSKLTTATGYCQEILALLKKSENEKA